MNRILIVACVLFMSVGAAMGQTGKPSADVAAIPEAIRTLKWQDVDLAQVSQLEKCRALMYLNYALDELSAVATSQADLMSAYIEAKNLGGEFANFPAPSGSPPFSYTDCQKIAVALLRGPMSDSPYSKELSDTDANGLQAYQNLYGNTCQQRWNELVEAKGQVRAMGAFIASKGKQREFQSWAMEESDRRQQKYESEMAAKAAAAGQKSADEAQAAKEREKAAAKERQLQAQNVKLQQALTSAQQQTAQAQQQTAQAQNNNNDGDDGWYAGWGYGAAANWNNHPWARDAANRPAAARNVQQRMGGWGGGAGGGARGSGGGGGRR